VADTAVGPYTFSDVALGKRDARYWDGQSAHNPKIMRFGDKFILYYMGSTHPFEPFPDGNDPKREGKHMTVGRSNKRVGIAIADNPYGPWERFDEPILPTRKNTFYSFLTSNPSPVIHEDGSVILMFKARAATQTQPGYGKMTIGVASAKNYLGPYRVVSEEPINLSQELGEIEDPSIWRDDRGYHMLAKDMDGSLSGEHHGGILCHSANGFDWQLDDDPLGYSRSITWDDGVKQRLGQMERVFPLLEEGKLTTLFFAVMDGPGGFDKGSCSWNMAIPLASH